ncbi:unnamed protein product [Cochlearia groenlandica]
MKSNDFSKSSRTDYSRRILGEAVSGDSPAESRMRGDLHVRLVTAHQNNCPRLLDRRRDAHSFKFKSGLSPLVSLELFKPLALLESLRTSPFSRVPMDLSFDSSCL